MTATTTSLIARNDTFLGICEAIGEDLGFHANYLRVALGVMVLWNPLAMIAAYLSLGVVVLATRWLFPSSQTAEAVEPAAPQRPEADNDTAAAPTALVG